ncbi:MAG TPA: tetratricopeptide repeat protein [Thermoanaerobaculia bacterium]|nr:tetratricopeptide repeat protein [Thermoanaerobaculia bacterium]
MIEVSSGKDHPEVAFGEVYLAEVYLARREPLRAEPLLRDALRIRLRLFRPDDWRIGVPKSLLGETFTSERRYDEAEGFLVEARRVLLDVPGEQAQEAQANRDRLAALDTARGRPTALAAAGPAAVPK